MSGPRPARPVRPRPARPPPPPTPRPHRRPYRAAARAPLGPRLHRRAPAPSCQLVRALPPRSARRCSGAAEREKRGRAAGGGRTVGARRVAGRCRWPLQRPPRPESLARGRRRRERRGQGGTRGEDRDLRPAPARNLNEGVGDEEVTRGFPPGRRGASRLRSERREEGARQGATLDRRDPKLARETGTRDTHPPSGFRWGPGGR